MDNMYQFQRNIMLMNLGMYYQPPQFVQETTTSSKETKFFIKLNDNQSVKRSFGDGESSSNIGEKKSRALPPKQLEEAGINNIFNVNSKPVNGRLVTMPNHQTRRQELQRENKPFNKYSPFILKQWKESDYYKHKKVYASRLKEQDKFKSPVSDNDCKDKQRQVKMNEFNAQKLKIFIKPIHRTDRWWIVADTKALLDDHLFIDRLVNVDPTCRLRIPYEVLHDLSAMTAKRNKHYMRLPARRVACYIHDTIGKSCGFLKIQSQITGQSATEAEDLQDCPVATDSVVNCCLQIMKHYFYVVLISDDPQRRSRAKSINLASVTLDEAKEMVTLKYSNYRESRITVTRNFNS